MMRLFLLSTLFASGSLLVAAGLGLMPPLFSLQWWMLIVGLYILLLPLQFRVLERDRSDR